MARKDPHSFSDLTQARVRHADLDWTIDFPKRQLVGQVRLEFASDASGPLDLDSRDLKIESVVDASGSAVPFRLGKNDPILGTCLTLTIPKPTKSVTIRYATSPHASALQWLEPAMTAGKKHPYLFSQCQPHHARAMVPIQDSPSVRFSYRAKVTAPKELNVVMSAAPGERKESGANAVFSFEMPQPIPAYLLAIAVGNITSRDLGPRARVYAEPETVEKAAWEFQPINKMLETAEKLFGAYRWDRYDFIVMPPSFPFGGMENPRLTFLTPTLLAGDRSLVDVLAHELAHSWTGNLVTNASMNDFWLNEGFTVWAESRIVEALEGTEALALHMTIGRHALEDEFERFKDQPALTHLKNDLSGQDPDEIYSRVPYEKGALFVILLERTVGRETWDRFIRDYMDRFQFTSITTEDFLAFLEEKFPGVYAKVDGKKWVHGPGLPPNAPTYHSKRLEELTALAGAWKQGKRPDPTSGKKWTPSDWQVYLGALPKELTAEFMRGLDADFALTKSGNAEVLCHWLERAAHTGYEPAYPRIREFLGSMGRMKFLKPLYKGLYERERTRKLALDIYAELRDTYHPIAQSSVRSTLKL